MVQLRIIIHSFIKNDRIWGWLWSIRHHGWSIQRWLLQKIIQLNVLVRLMCTPVSYRQQVQMVQRLRLKEKWGSSLVAISSKRWNKRRWLGWPM